MGRQPGFANYVATAVVGRRRRGARAGLAAYAGPRHGVGIELRRGRAVVWQLEAGRSRVLAAARTARSRSTAVRMRVTRGNIAAFELLAGGAWQRVGPEAQVVQLLYDDVHAVLRVAGPARASAAFERFELSSLEAPPPGTSR